MKWLDELSEAMCPASTITRHRLVSNFVAPFSYTVVNSSTLLYTAVHCCFPSSASMAKHAPQGCHVCYVSPHPCPHRVYGPSPRVSVGSAMCSERALRGKVLQGGKSSKGERTPGEEEQSETEMRKAQSVSLAFIYYKQPSGAVACFEHSCVRRSV